MIISGDKNDLDVKLLLSVDPSLKRINNKPTRCPKLLDVVIPPIVPDLPDKGVPSDHLGVIGMPHINNEPRKTSKIHKMIRPLPDSLMNIFGHELLKFLLDISQIR